MYFLRLVAYKMSQLDTELTLLKQKIAALEEQKRIELEKETEKKENPLKVLEEILNEKKKCRNMLAESPTFENGRPRSIIPTMYMQPDEFAWLCNQNDKVKYLEPIVNMLQDIQKRLDALEKKEINLLEGLVL